MPSTRANADDVFAVVRQAVVTVLEVPAESVTPGTAFDADLRADSLALVELAEIIEERLAPRARRPFRMADTDLPRLGTVGGAVDYAVARL